MRHAALLFVAVVLIATAGCAKKVAEESAPEVASQTGKPGSSLAYEHSMEVVLAAEAISDRMTAVRAACMEAKFGDCTLLRFEHSDGEHPRGSLTLRVAPDAVEPLAALAAEQGRLGSRQTRAEDLAEAVHDTGKQREMLGLQRATLLEFRSRSDLLVSDVITVARELATVESELQSLARTAADQQRRIETNLLSIQFSTDFQRSRWTRLGKAFGDSVDSAINGSAEAIEMLAFGLPFLFIAFPLSLLWRWAWRRMTGSRSAS